MLWADMEGPGCCMEPIIPLGLASGILGLFLYPHQLIFFEDTISKVSKILNLY